MLEAYDLLLKQVESLKAELACAQAFHNVAVKERDLARTQLAHAQADAEQAVHHAMTERDEALVKYQFMVDRAADEKLDGYRELRARAAEAENGRERAERERNTLVRMLVSEFGWSDTSYVHAIMHVENAIRNLRADLAVARREAGTA